jgi:hypothetical protein
VFTQEEIGNSVTKVAGRRQKPAGSHENTAGLALSRKSCGFEELAKKPGAC